MNDRISICKRCEYLCKRRNKNVKYKQIVQITIYNL